MATPRHRKRTTLSATLRYEACSQSTATKSRSTTAKSRTATKPRSTTKSRTLRSHVLLLRPKLVLSLRRAKPEPSPRVLRRVRLPLSHVLLHIDRDKDRNKAACFNHKGIDYTKACHTYSGEETCLRSTTRKVGGGAGCGSENWVGLTPVNQAYYSGVVARR
jgi:hypothetical protein